MFKELFATMNDVLDQIMEEYPSASESKKRELDQEIDVLKHMSDVFVEEWLNFEEKLGIIQASRQEDESISASAQGCPLVTNTLNSSQMVNSASFKKAQGYFNLYMFHEAVKEFEQLVEKHPDFVLARLYLALGYLINGNLYEASRHFQFIIPVSDQEHVKAVAFNAMGCIQFKWGHDEKASEYFEKAYACDPNLLEAKHNLEVLRGSHGSLELGLGLV